MTSLVTITINDRNARQLLGDIKTNIPKVANKMQERVLKEAYTKEFLKRARKHRFMGVLESVFVGGNAIRKTGRFEMSIVAPKYLLYLDRGTKKHWVSLDKHPIVARWIIQKGKGLKRGQKYALIRTHEYRVIRDSISAGNTIFRSIIRDELGRFVRARGKVAA
jgi:hypothetical protein